MMVGVSLQPSTQAIPLRFVALISAFSSLLMADGKSAGKTEREIWNDGFDTGWSAGKNYGKGYAHGQDDAQQRSKGKSPNEDKGKSKGRVVDHVSVATASGEPSSSERCRGQKRPAGDIGG